MCAPVFVANNIFLLAPPRHPAPRFPSQEIAFILTLARTILRRGQRVPTLFPLGALAYFTSFFPRRVLPFVFSDLVNKKNKDLCSEIISSNIFFRTQSVKNLLLTFFYSYGKKFLFFKYKLVLIIILLLIYLHSHLHFHIRYFTSLQYLFLIENLYTYMYINLIKRRKLIFFKKIPNQDDFYFALVKRLRNLY